MNHLPQRPLVAFSTSFLVALGLGACDPSGTGTDLATSAQAIGCPIESCGSSTPRIEGFNFSELHQAPAGQDEHLSNQDGLILSRFMGPDGVGARFAVTASGELQVLNDDGSIRFAGDDVVGSVFLVQQVATGLSASVHIKERRTDRAYWVGQAESIPSYSLTYTQGKWNESQSVCPTAIDGTSDAFLFTGERYSIETRDILASGEDAVGWLNLACSGSPTFDMIAYRHRPEALPGDEFYTEADQRQALLRMFAADYHGNGMSFSQPGVEITWMDRNGWMTPSSEGDVEAVWGPEGVVCLETPRLLGLLPDIWDIIGQHGSIPKCDARFKNWQQQGYYFKSWLP